MANENDQLSREELAYIADWLSKPEVRTALARVIVWMLRKPTAPPAQIPALPPFAGGVMVPPIKQPRG